MQLISLIPAYLGDQFLEKPMVHFPISYKSLKMREFYFRVKNYLSALLKLKKFIQAKF